MFTNVIDVMLKFVLDELGWLFIFMIIQFFELRKCILFTICVKLVYENVPLITVEYNVFYSYLTPNYS